MVRNANRTEFARGWGSVDASAWLWRAQTEVGLPAEGSRKHSHHIEQTQHELSGLGHDGDREGLDASISASKSECCECLSHQWRLSKETSLGCARVEPQGETNVGLGRELLRR